MRTMPRGPRRAAALALAAAAAACAPSRTAPVGPARLVWPPPPDSARIEFVRAIKFLQDVTGRRPGVLQRLATGGEAPLFERPYGVAADGASRLYVADPVQRSLWRLDLAAGTVTRVGGSGAGTLARPCCVAVTSGGLAYVTDVEGRRVVVFDRDGSYRFAFGGRDVFDRPAGLAVNEALRRVYVVDLDRQRVTVHDLETGRLLFDFGARGDRDGEFNRPSDVAVDSLGRVYVLDALNFRVQRFSPDGIYQDSFGSAGDSPGQFARPKGIALDSDLNTYVVDAAFGNFQIFDREFSLLLVVGQNGAEAGQMQLPAGIALGCDGSIYVADGLNDRILVFRRVDRPARCMTSDIPRPE